MRQLPQGQGSSMKTSMPSTSRGSRVLSQSSISQEIADIRSRLTECYFERLPLEIFYHLLLFMTIPSIITLECVSKSMKQRIAFAGIFTDYASRSQYALVRRLSEFIQTSSAWCGVPEKSWDLILATPIASRYPLVLEHNMNLLITELEIQLVEGCRRVRFDHNKNVENRFYYGYTECARQAFKLAKSVIFLELLSLRISALKYNCSFPGIALSVTQLVHNAIDCHVLSFPSSAAQDRGNIEKVVKCLKNRRFASAGRQIRSRLIPITTSLSRVYHHIHFTTRSNTLLHLTCRPDLISSYGLPDGSHLVCSQSGIPQFPPALIHEGEEIVDVSSDDADSDVEEGDNVFHNPGHYNEVFNELPWAMLPGALEAAELPPPF